MMIEKNFIAAGQGGISRYHENQKGGRMGALTRKKGVEMPSKILVTVAVLFSFACALPVPGLSAEKSAEKKDLVGTEIESLDRVLYPTEELIGKQVSNARGEQLGEIQEFMLDPESGRIVFAVVSTGGVMGLGNGTHFVPWRALARDRDRYLIDIGKEEMAREPARTAEMTDEEYLQEIHQFYGVSPYWQDQPPEAQTIRQEKKPVSEDMKRSMGD